MLLQEYDAYFRILTNEPDQTGRWSQADAATLINQARFALNSEIDFPAGTISIMTNPGQQEYVLPAISKILRAKLAGQVLIETTINTLEGQQLEYYDASNNGLPQWNTQTPAVFPQANIDYTSPYPNTLPFFQGQRAMFYMRDQSGTIGIVPPPIGAYFLALDVVPFPNILVAPTDNDDLYDQHFKELICQGAVVRAFQADRDSGARGVALESYAIELKRIRGWLADMMPVAPRGPVVNTYRGFYQNNARVRN